MKKSILGFSLVEVMISTAIISIGMLALMAIAIYGATFALGLKERLEAQNQAVFTEFTLRSLFSQAMSVDGSTAPLTAANWINGGFTGNIIADRNFDQMADSSATGWDSIAVFNRENSITNISDTRKTGIWYKAPTPTTSGILFIYLDAGVERVGTIADGLSMVPDDYGEGGGGTDANPFAGIYIDRLVEFQIQKENHVIPPNSRTKEVLIRTTFRYFNNPAGVRSWCPRADIGIAACPAAGASRFNDLEHSFRITLRNNNLSDDIGDFGSGLLERPIGNIHFFKLVVPRALLN